jgi:hypothetical protein
MAQAPKIRVVRKIIQLMTNPVLFKQRLMAFCTAIDLHGVGLHARVEGGINLLATKRSKNGPRGR